MNSMFEAGLKRGKQRGREELRAELIKVVMELKKNMDMNEISYYSIGFSRACEKFLELLNQKEAGNER